MCVPIVNAEVHLSLAEWANILVTIKQGGQVGCRVSSGPVILFCLISVQGY